MAYDLLIRGGTVIDPRRNLSEVRDIGIRDGRIAAVERDLTRSGGAERVLDAAGRIVTPGLVDMHVHIYHGATEFGIEPDPWCLARGATTVFDAGSAGALTFGGLAKYVLEPSAGRIRAFLNLSSHGMISRDLGELIDLRFADVARAVQVCRDHERDICGIKIRVGRQIVEDRPEEMLARAVQVCGETGLPLMVHPNKAATSLAAILSAMRPGDILTHCFHCSPTQILDQEGRLRPEVREARSRGVVFDVGHGMGSFSFEVAEAALDQGFEPDTISTDLHHFNIHGPVYDLPTTLSKFLMMGMDLSRVIAKATEAPAEIMGMREEIGSLAVGSPADIAILELASGQFSFSDTVGVMRSGGQCLVPVTVIKAGKPYERTAATDR